MSQERRGLSRRRFLEIVGVGGGAALLAACQPSTTGVQATTGTKVSPSAAATDPNATINYAISGEPFGLDPAPTGAAQTKQITYGIFDGLTSLNDNYEAQPALATGWTTSPDRLTWSFTLRQDAVFHDGGPVDAAAVKFSIDRVLDPANKLAGNRFVAPLISAVKVVAPNKVDIVLKQPYGALPSLMSTDATFIVSPKAVAQYGADFTRHPVGSGAYVFKEWIAGQRITVERNDKYWGDKAKNARVIYLPVSEDSTRVAMVQTGQADIAQYVSPTDAKRLTGAAGFQVLEAEALEVRTLKFNMLDPRTSDPRIRQALQYALDLKTITDTVLEGTANPATGPVPRGVPSAIQTPKYTYNPAKAKQLIADAGWSGGTLTIAYTPGSTGSSQDEIMQAIQAQWKAVGVNSELKSLDTAAFATYRSTPPTNPAAPSKGLLSHGSTLQYPDPWLLRGAYASDSMPPAGSDYGFYRNTRVDQLFDQGQGESDETKRNAIFTEFQNIILEDMPVILLYQQRWLYIAKGLAPVDLPATENLVFATVQKFAK